jgi:hypothetical protein
MSRCLSLSLSRFPETYIHQAIWCWGVVQSITLPFVLLARPPLDPGWLRVWVCVCVSFDLTRGYPNTLRTLFLQTYTHQGVWRCVLYRTTPYRSFSPPNPGWLGVSLSLAFHRHIYIKEFGAGVLYRTSPYDSLSPRDLPDPGWLVLSRSLSLVFHRHIYIKESGAGCCTEHHPLLPLPTSPLQTSGGWVSGCLSLSLSLSLVFPRHIYMKEFGAGVLYRTSPTTASSIPKCCCLKVCAQ